MRAGFQPWRTAALGDQRPVLQGVFVDPKGYLVASDGWTLSVVPCKLKGAPRSFTGAIVPAPFVKDAAKSIRRSPTWWPLFKLDMASGQAICAFNSDSEIRTALTKGTFPDWRDLIPAKRDLGKPTYQSFQPALLVALMAAIDAEIPTMFWAKNGGPSVVVGGQEGAFGLLMPLLNNNVLREPQLKRALRLRKARPPLPAVPAE